MKDIKQTPPRQSELTNVINGVQRLIDSGRTIKRIVISPQRLFGYTDTWMANVVFSPPLHNIDVYAERVDRTEIGYIRGDAYHFDAVVATRLSRDAIAQKLLGDKVRTTVKEIVDGE